MTTMKIDGIKFYSWKIPGDGNCLFSSINDQLKYTLKWPEEECPNQSTLRAIAVKHIRENMNQYASFFSEGEDPETYLSGIENNAWGDQLAIAALTNSLKLCIGVAQKNGNVCIKHGDPTNPTIYLIYVKNSHYNSLRKEKPSQEQEDIWLAEKIQHAENNNIPHAMRKKKTPLDDLKDELEKAKEEHQKERIEYEKICEVFEKKDKTAPLHARYRLDAAEEKVQSLKSKIAQLNSSFHNAVETASSPSSASSSRNGSSSSSSSSSNSNNNASNSGLFSSYTPATAGSWSRDMMARMSSILGKKAGQK